MLQHVKAEHPQSDLMKDTGRQLDEAKERRLRLHCSTVLLENILHGDPPPVSHASASLTRAHV